MKFQCESCRYVAVVGKEQQGKTVTCGKCECPTTVPASATSVRSVIGDFAIVGDGRKDGGVTLFPAHQFSEDRPVTLAILRPELAQDEGLAAAFMREGRNAMHLLHPNLAQVYVCDHHEDLYFAAFERVGGESVEDVLTEKGRFDVMEALRIVRDVAAGLNHSWQTMEMVHGDISPSNVMVDQGGTVKLIGMGLLLPTTGKAAQDRKVEVDPHYFCPEKVLGARMDVRSDVYSLGATLYHMLAGRCPFEDQADLDSGKRHVYERLTPPREVSPDVPECASDLVVKMMKKNPARRYRGPKALTADVDAVIGHLTRNLPRERRSIGA